MLFIIIFGKLLFPIVIDGAEFFLRSGKCVNVFSVGEEQKANAGAVEAVLQHPTDADKVP